MTEGRDQSPSGKQAQVDAEAAAWLARLQRPDRDQQLEAKFRQWLASDPSHAATFDRATQIWDVLGGVGGGEPDFAVSRSARGDGAAWRTRKAFAAVVATLAVVVLAGWWLSMRPTVYETQVGEQRTVRLADGTQVLLNTDTRAKVRYARRRRSVELEHGEAIFDVAKDPGRPFVVTAADRDVRATGTSFVVRTSEGALAVTLLEGAVVVGLSAGLPAGRGRPVDDGRVVLAPGDQLRVVGGRQAVDRPVLDTVTAWRRGEVIFDATPLSTAVAEMNRYSTRPLAVASAGVGSLRVSGLFKTADSEAFAKTVSALYSLNVTTGPGGSLMLSAGRSGG